MSMLDILRSITQILLLTASTTEFLEHTHFNTDAVISISPCPGCLRDSLTQPKKIRQTVVSQYLTSIALDFWEYHKLDIRLGWLQVKDNS